MHSYYGALWIAKDRTFRQTGDCLNSATAQTDQSIHRAHCSGGIWSVN